MDEQKTELKRPRSWPRLLLIAAMGMGYGLVMMTIFRQPGMSGQGAGVALLAFLVLVPLGIGALSAATVPRAVRTPGRVISVALTTGGIFMLAAALAFPGVLLCVLMAAPFVVIPLIIGALLNWYASRRGEKPKRQYAFTGLVLLLPLLVGPFEAMLEPPTWIRTVEDSVIIAGTPEAVWEQIIRMTEIDPADQRPSWYHTLGIPRPMYATLDGEGVGAVRMGHFAEGLLFREEITMWEPYTAVRFSVDVEQNGASTPVLRQIGGAHFDILDAGYRIEAVDDAHVRLTLNSTYRLSTNFNFYGAFWADWIMHDFQRYVLNTAQVRVATLP
ncbi:MAG: SRPBCC family protein [Chloroflexi bacterium]|nr:SRPBCC family protein [Chloroflexota bacterium]